MFLKDHSKQILLGSQCEAVLSCIQQIQSKMDDHYRNQLKINEEKGVLTLQTGGLAVQAIFESPILEVCNYLENLEKYRLRGALSSINLKAQEFNMYYSEVKEKADRFYHSLIHRSLTIFQDLLIAAKFAKNQLWHEQAMLANGLRTAVYMKQLDPYNFDPSQFDSDQQEVIETLRRPLKESEECRKVIGEFAQKLKSVQSQKMDEMYAGKVRNPYIAQNKQGQEVDPSSLYSSYLIYLRIKTERSEEALIRKHFAVHEEVVKFGQAIFQYSLKLQRNAALLIRRYSENSAPFQTTHIAPPLQLQIRRHHLDADQLSLGKQARSQSKPALANKNCRIQFKTYNRVFNCESMTEQLVEQIENDERGHFDNFQSSDQAPRQSPFESFTERKRVLYKDYYQHRELQRKLREEEIRYGHHKELKEREKVIIRRIIRTNAFPAPWAEFVDQESPFFYYLQSRQQKENSIWDQKNKYGEADFLTSKARKEKETQEKKKDEQFTQITREEQKIFEQRRRQEEESRLASLKPLLDSRTYSKFLQASKMEPSPAEVCNEYVKRYGMMLKRPINKNSARELDKFFYYFFKQFFKQNEEVVDNASNPIVFLDAQKVSMNSSAKVVGQYVSSIVKRVQSMPFFLVWSDDLISFRLNSDTEKNHEGKFECFNFSCGDNCKKLIYEIKRRVSLKIVEKIYECGKADGEGDQIMRKIEVAHRVIFNQHCQILDIEESVSKGTKIGEEIINSLR